LCVLSDDPLAAQLRHPHGDPALAVAESMNRSNGALNHAAIALLAVAELARVLRPGGRLCLAFGDAGFIRTLPFTAYGFHLHALAEVELALRGSGLRVCGWRSHREQGASNDGRVVDKHFHLLLARR
jgi:SAM-dependent methyltransferase